jgi:tricarballylate dehydrogenase
MFARDPGSFLRPRPGKGRTAEPWKHTGLCRFWSNHLISEQCDVLVIGGGNAGVCAALSAHETGATVQIVEHLDAKNRGGNSKYTRNLRCASDRYPDDEVLSDLISVTGDEIDLPLARHVIRASREAPAWMATYGVRFAGAFRGTIALDRTNWFFLGGGKALLNVYYRAVERLGIPVAYETRAVSIVEDGTGFAVALETAAGPRTVRCGALVTASGGYESNYEWLESEWGTAARQFLIRGASTNDGAVIKMLAARGAQKTGNPKGFHSIAIDARSPRYDGGIVTRVDSIPHGIVVNQYCKRFYDEGEMIWPKRYASWGRLIAQQDGQIAYSIYDTQTRGNFVPACFPPVEAGTIPELARKLELDPDALAATVQEYNAHTVPGTFDITGLDGLSTRDLTPAKSNWARPIDQAPFYAYPVRPGITFTYLGVKVDAQARVLDTEGRTMAGIFAAGEIMAGNLLTNGYLAGFGMTIGTVMGRIAGREAGAYAAATQPARR